MKLFISRYRSATHSERLDSESRPREAERREQSSPIQRATTHLADSRFTRPTRLAMRRRLQHHSSSAMHQCLLPAVPLGKRDILASPQRNGRFRGSSTASCVAQEVPVPQLCSLSTVAWQGMMAAFLVDLGLHGLISRNLSQAIVFPTSFAGLSLHEDCFDIA